MFFVHKTIIQYVSYAVHSFVHSLRLCHGNVSTENIYNGCWTDEAAEVSYDRAHSLAFYNLVIILDCSTCELDFCCRNKTIELQAACPSVCLSHSCKASELMNLGSCGFQFSTDA